MQTDLPNDPMILLSYVNTQLRDHYGSLDDFCGSEGVNRSDLEQKLGTIDYVYDPEHNAFV